MKRYLRVIVEDLRFDNIRKLFAEEELRPLGQSLLKRQNHPIIIRTGGWVLDGQRRAMAAKLVGIKELDAVETDEDLTPDQIVDIQFTTAFHRADLTGGEKWQALLAISAAHPDWNGKQLAASLDISEGMVTRLLCPSRTSPACQKALLEGKITLAQCDPISKAPAEDHDALLTAALNGATRDKLEALRKKLEADRNNPPTDSAARLPKIRIPLANDTATGIVTVAGDEIDLEGAETILKEALKAVRSAKEKNLDPKTAQRVWADMAKGA